MKYNKIHFDLKLSHFLHTAFDLINKISSNQANHKYIIH